MEVVKEIFKGYEVFLLLEWELLELAGEFGDEGINVFMSDYICE